MRNSPKKYLFILIFLSVNLNFLNANTYTFKENFLSKIQNIFINYKVYLSPDINFKEIESLNQISSFKIRLTADNNLVNRAKTESDIVNAENKGGLFFEFEVDKKYFYTNFSSIKYILRANEDFALRKKEMKNNEIIELNGDGIWIYKLGNTYNLTEVDPSSIFISLLGYKDRKGHPYIIFYNPEYNTKSKNFKTTIISFDEFRNGIREGLFLIPNEKAILELIKFKK